MTEKTGWERENRVHFDDIVNVYDKVRVGYPTELFDALFNYASSSIPRTAIRCSCLAENMQRFKHFSARLTTSYEERWYSRAIEIGAGTGKATVPFLNAGYDVTAVEIGKNMVDFLNGRFADNKNFSVINDSFENAVFENESYDIIYAATAFHWVDAEIGCPKALRLLKKGGTFALFRYNHQPSEGESLYEEIQACYERHYNRYYTKKKKPVRKSHADFLKPSEIYTSFRFDGMEQYGFSQTAMKFYEATLKYSADDYISLLDTYSDHRALPEENRKNLYADVRNVIIKHGGVHSLDCTYQLYMGRK